MYGGPDKQKNSDMLLLNKFISLIILSCAKIFYKYNILDIKSKYLLIIDKHRKINFKQIHPILLEMLILAEDRKYYYHIGIDVIAILRAIYFTLKGKRQGASTITQQYIRVLINDYEITIRRKIIEIFLALLVNAKIDKRLVLCNYLSIAYFGFNMDGIDSVFYHLNQTNNLTSYQAASIIARLKYPQKRDNFQFRQSLLERRIMYLNELYKKKNEICYIKQKKPAVYPYPALDEM